MMRYIVAGCLLLLVACEPVGGGPKANEDPDPSPAPPAEVRGEDPVRATVDKWLVSWSEAQAASIRQTCEAEPGCAPAAYMPEARPMTSFGWDGAEQIERTADWARGERYWVTANRRRVLLYLEGGRVVGAYVEDANGRRSICRDDECY